MTRLRERRQAPEGGWSAHIGAAVTRWNRMLNPPSSTEFIELVEVVTDCLRFGLPNDWVYGQAAHLEHGLGGVDLSTWRFHDSELARLKACLANLDPHAAPSLHRALRVKLAYPEPPRPKTPQQSRFALLLAKVLG